MTGPSQAGDDVKRYYISPVVMQQSGDLLGETVPVVEFQSKYPHLNCATKILYGPNNELLSNYALIIAAGTDHSGPAADARMGAFPDLTLDSPLSVLPNRTRNQFISKLGSFGIDTSWITAQTTVRELIDGIGSQLSPGFSANAFDAIELA